MATLLKSMLFLLITAISFNLHAQSGTENGSEQRLVVMLRGLAAECSIQNSLLKADLPQNPSLHQVQTAEVKSSACAANQLPVGKVHYRQAIERAPASRSLLAALYARWLRYMDALSRYYDTDEQAQTEQQFEAAISDITAELHAR